MTKDITYIGYCANCYSDIIEGDHMDCCQERDIIDTREEMPVTTQHDLRYTD